MELGYGWISLVKGYYLALFAVVVEIHFNDQRMTKTYVEEMDSSINYDGNWVFVL